LLEASIVVVIVSMLFVVVVVGRVTAFYWMIVKHFNFTGQGTLYPVIPLAYRHGVLREGLRRVRISIFKQTIMP
jgi:hypothetical protein